MKTFIYCLLDPRDGKPRYIGKANNPAERLKNHLNPAKYKPDYKTNWIKQLRQLDLKPILKILEEISFDIWKDREKHWIRYFTKKGYKLVNGTGGGDGLTFSNQTSFKKGHESWNKGLGNKEICSICNAEFYASQSSKRQFCSMECSAIHSSQNPNKGTFKKGQEVWNKGISNYKLGGLKQSKPILQFDLQGNFIKEFPGCKEAALEMNCIPETIRVVCAGKNKTAKGYIWKYKPIHNESQNTN